MRTFIRAVCLLHFFTLFLLLVLIYARDDSDTRYVINGSSWLAEASDTTASANNNASGANANVACSTQEIYDADRSAYANAFPAASGGSDDPALLSLWMIILIALGGALLVAVIVAIHTRSKHRKQAAAAAQKAAEVQARSAGATPGPPRVNRVPSDMESITLSPATYVPPLPLLESNPLINLFPMLLTVLSLASGLA